MVRGVRPTKSEVVTAKLDPGEKAKLKKSGYNARQAIEYFNMARGKPCESIEIDLHFMKQDLRSTKVDMMQKEYMIKDLEERLEKLGGSEKEITEEDKLNELIEEFVYMYHINPYYSDISVEEAVEMAHKGLARKADDLGYDFDYVKSKIIDDFPIHTRNLFKDIK